MKDTETTKEQHPLCDDELYKAASDIVKIRMLYAYEVGCTHQRRDSYNVYIKKDVQTS